ncbi:MAG TPA: hypothetical protein VFE51_30160 [Verrucomicrobiae bacterium]|nr:hypothetical protein [Verrucomicrobiae bacterium]
MTVEQAEAVLSPTGVTIALQHRFAFDTGTILRLDNYAMINIFDDGRYYIQGENIESLVALFRATEEPWDPETWSGELPQQGLPPIFPLS